MWLPSTSASVMMMSCGSGASPARCPFGGNPSSGSTSLMGRTPRAVMMVRISLLERSCPSGLLDIQDLPARGEDGLELPVSALLGRAAGRVALTRKSSLAAGSRSWQSASLPGGSLLQRALAPRDSRAFRRLARQARLDTLPMDGAARRVLFE